MTRSIDTSGNLVVNGDFSQWNADNNALLVWNTSHAQGCLLTPDTGGGVVLSGNVPTPGFIFQDIPLEGDKYYKASINTDYAIYNYFSGGLYIMDEDLRTILGKFERTYSSGSEDTWEVVFNSGSRDHVVLALGFINGINAEVYFRNTVLKEYEYPSTIASSEFARHLETIFPVDFTAMQFDSTVCRIADYVNSVLLCRRTYFDDTVELPLLASMIGNDPAYSYFNGYRDSLDQVNIGYCQKSSLSLAEILTNEFHIPVRQVHMVFGDVGKHQFTEYWNPFAGKWIAIDPCFNTYYAKDNVLEGVEEFDRSEAIAQMVKFGTHSFYTEAPEDLPWYWQNMDNLMITDYYSISFPFAL